ncbi:MAG: hypothetical protein M1820_008373 [Bogoriella megaspora]|nr:MAG: hypothetical protein M1820_008373 [Bogoriella megaspora]
MDSRPFTVPFELERAAVFLRQCFMQLRYHCFGHHVSGIETSFNTRVLLSEKLGSEILLYSPLDPALFNRNPDDTTAALALGSNDDIRYMMRAAKTILEEIRAEVAVVTLLRIGATPIFELKGQSSPSPQLSDDLFIQVTLQDFTKWIIDLEGAQFHRYQLVLPLNQLLPNIVQHRLRPDELTQQLSRRIEVGYHLLFEDSPTMEAKCQILLKYHFSRLLERWLQSLKRWEGPTLHQLFNEQDHRRCNMMSAQITDALCRTFQHRLEEIVQNGLMRQSLHGFVATEWTLRVAELDRVPPQIDWNVSKHASVGLPWL